MGELVEVLDADGRVVDVVPRSEMRRRNLRHRSVAVVVLTTDARLLVHRRAAHKDVWPSMWDLCVGGVVAAGEDVVTAAQREAAEEAGIVVAADQLLPLGAGRFDDHEVRTIVDVFITRHDGPFRAVDGEVAEWRLVSADELRELARIERFVPDSWACVLPLVPSFDEVATRR